MADIVGGLRARLVKESLFRMLYEALEDLNWFDPSNPASPIEFHSRMLNREERIEFNTAALTDENETGEEIELGSGLTESKWTFYVDFFAENDAIGLHFIQDVKAILEGRMTVINRFDSTFDVYDYRQATPPILFTCQIEDVGVDRAHGFLKPWLEHWYAVQFVVVDVYNRDDS